MTQHIGLLDCNNFFVSCERLFRPDLQHVPVLVLSSNDGCVVARSQEVKDIGIPMGVPYFKIKDIVKDNNIHVFSGNITLYRDVSRRVFDVLRSQYSTVEQYSVDEAFFILDPCEADTKQLQSLRDKIYREVGIPVSIGVAPSKTLAKIATDTAKADNGVYVHDDAHWQHDSTAKPLATIWGIGRRLAEQYKDAGLVTVADLLATDTSLLRQRFGVVAVRQQSELSGQAVSVVTPSRPLQQSLMSSRSFKKALSDKAIIADALAYHVRHIAADLRAMQATVGTIRVSLRTNRHGDFFLRGGSAEAVLPQASDDSFQLLQVAQTLLQDLYEPGVPYQKVGVTVHNIAPKAAQQQTLFADDRPNNDALMETIDALNTGYDKELVTVGSRLQTHAWQAKSGMRSGCYTTRWSDIATVSAN